MCNFEASIFNMHISFVLLCTKANEGDIEHVHNIKNEREIARVSKMELSQVDFDRVKVNTQVHRGWAAIVSFNQWELFLA